MGLVILIIGATDSLVLSSLLTYIIFLQYKRTLGEENRPRSTTPRDSTQHSIYTQPHGMPFLSCDDGTFNRLSSLPGANGATGETGPPYDPSTRYHNPRNHEQHPTTSMSPRILSSNASCESQFPLASSSTYLSTGDYGHRWERRALSNDTDESDEYSHTTSGDYFNRFDHVDNGRTRLEREL